MKTTHLLQTIGLILMAASPLGRSAAGDAAVGEQSAPGNQAKPQFVPQKKTTVGIPGKLSVEEDWLAISAKGYIKVTAVEDHFDFTDNAQFIITKMNVKAKKPNSESPDGIYHMNLIKIEVKTTDGKVQYSAAEFRNAGVRVDCPIGVETPLELSSDLAIPLPKFTMRDDQQFMLYFILYNTNAKGKESPGIAGYLTLGEHAEDK